MGDVTDTLRDVLADVLSESYSTRYPDSDRMDWLSDADYTLARLAARNVVLSDGALREAARQVAHLKRPSPVGRLDEDKDDPYAVYIHGCERMRSAVLDVLAATEDMP